MRRWRSQPWTKDLEKNYNKNAPARNTPEYLAAKVSRSSARRAKCREVYKNLQKSDKDRIIRIYERCRMLTEITGIQHHVDHIIPISKGGQHHPDNLQILTAEENLKKGSKLISGQDEKPIVKELSDISE